MSDKTFDEVMAEEWIHDDGAIGHRAEPHQPMLCRFRGTQAEAEMRAAIAVLGKRALVLVLKHEMCGGKMDNVSQCPECLSMDASEHEGDCEWGAIMAEVKKLRVGVGWGN